MSNYFAYKFDKTRKEMVYNRLELITKMTMVQGPQYIVAVLERIKMSKQLFVLELEQGREVLIPKVLSQVNLPQSFRYYDPIIRIT